MKVLMAPSSNGHTCPDSLFMTQKLRNKLGTVLLSLLGVRSRNSQFEIETVKQPPSRKKTLIVTPAYFHANTLGNHIDTGRSTHHLRRQFYYFFKFIFLFISFYLFIYFLFVVNFLIHWNETAMGLHVFPIPIPPPTSLSTCSL